MSLTAEQPETPRTIASSRTSRLPAGAVVDGAASRGTSTRRSTSSSSGSGAARGGGGAHAGEGRLVGGHRRGGAVGEDARLRGATCYGAFRACTATPGRRSSRGASYIPLIQGRCVGGSTVMNSAIAHRTPEDVLAEWAKRFGLGEPSTSRRSSPTSTRSSAISTPTPCWTTSSAKTTASSSTTARAPGASRRRGCPATSAAAGLGAMRAPAARTAAKQGMNVSYVPWALSLGARIYCSCRVERVDVAGRTGRRRRWRGRRAGSTGRQCPHACGCARARRPGRGEHRADAEPPPAERPSRARDRRATSSATPGIGARRRVRRADRDDLRRDAGRREHAAPPDRSDQARDDLDAARARRRTHPGRRAGAACDRFGVVRERRRVGGGASAPRRRGR